MNDAHTTIDDRASDDPIPRDVGYAPLVRLSRIALLMLLVAACQRGAPTRETSPADAGPVAPPPIAAEAAARCRATLERIGAAPDDGRDFFIDFAAGCAAIHSDAACRDAWAEAARAPVLERTAVLARRCAPAACPALPLPRPVLCAALEENVPARTLEKRWFELYRTLVERDLGPRDAGLAKLLVELQKPAPPPPAAVLQLLPEKDGRWLVQVGTAAPEQIETPLNAANLARLADAMARLAPPPAGVALVRAEMSVTDAALAPLLKSLSDKGFRDVAVERVPGR